MSNDNIRGGTGSHPRTQSYNSFTPGLTSEISVRRNYGSVTWEGSDTMDDVRSYRAYLLSASNHILSVAVLTAIDDASACEEAGDLLQRAEYAAVEVWERQRLVSHIDRTQDVA